MHYDAELRFFMTLMNNCHLRTIRFALGDPPEMDMGLRRLLGLKDPAASLFQRAQPNAIYHVIDAFDCCYTGLLLPGADDALLMGPYLRHEKNDTDIMALLERCQLPTTLFKPLKHYYNALPLFNQDHLMLAALNALGEALWGELNAFTVEEINDWESPDLLSQLPAPSEQEREEISFRMVEERYEVERSLINAVAHGMHHQAHMIIARWRADMMEQRVSDPIRNLRNYAIVLNTLLRKAAEQGNVHPVHIDRLSSSFAQKIERFHSLNAGAELLQTMVHKYCLLVKNHSMQHYSRLVQHVILRVETDLTADLSLKAHAEHFSVNASYLSSLFKKETGSTLTDYVNRTRIDHAIFLLNVTDMQVQTIAQYCGIPDVNYFTKLFKRSVGKTPKEYRQETRG